MKIRIFAVIFVLFLSTLFICCDEDKVTSPDGGYDPPVKITRDNCIELLEEAFNEIDIKKYRRLLLKPDTSNVFRDGYIWKNRERDFIGGTVDKEFFDYYEDIEATDSLFAHTREDTFFIRNGRWDTLETFRERQCIDCMETIRSYYLDLTTDQGRHFWADFFYIRIIIGPDPDLEGGYLIYQAEDLREISSINKLPSDTERTSLGEAKNAFLTFPE